MRNKFIITLLFIFLSCSIGEVKKDKKMDNENFKKNNPHLYLENRPIEARELSDKYVELSEKDINELKIKNSDFGYEFDSNPKSVDRRSLYYSWFKQEINSMPSEVKKLLLKRVHGWSLVEGLGSSGLLYGLYNNYHDAEKGIVILDVSLFKKSYKEGCFYKENTVYQLRKNEFISCDYKGANISFAKAIFYHEAGHAFSYLNAFYSHKMNFEEQGHFPFNRLSWIEHGSSYASAQSKFDKAIPNRKEIRYYPKDIKLKVNSEKIKSILEEWEKTNFFTLYSMTHPAEDWAETFMHYLISTYHNGKFVVKYGNSKGEIKEYASCNKNNDCLKKMKLMDLYIKNIDLFI